MSKASRDDTAKTDYPSYVVGLAIAVGMWFATIVAFVCGIVLVPVSPIMANIVALLAFSGLLFMVGLKSGRRAWSASWIVWALAGAGWLIPWIGAGYFIEGLSEDLGGTVWAPIIVSVVLVVIPAFLIWFGARRAGARG